MLNYFEALYKEIVTSTINFLPNFISGLLTFAMFFVVAFLISKIFKRANGSKCESRHIAFAFIQKSIRITIIGFGIVSMLGTWGINVSALVAGLGLTGFALGFALKDALSSILAGIMLLIYRPFNIGDIINTCGVEGRVADIDMRYTTIISEGKRNLVPNSKLLSEMVTIG